MYNYYNYIKENFSNIFTIADYIETFVKIPLEDVFKLEINANVTSIFSLEGIELLPNLRKLYINRNLLQNLDGIEKCQNLIEIGCAYNKLDSVSGLKYTPIEKVFVQNNNLSKIEDISELKNLLVLNCADNKIESLDGIENLSKLRTLRCEYNKLNEIDDIPDSLEKLECYANKLPYEDLDGFWFWYYDLHPDKREAKKFGL